MVRERLERPQTLGPSTYFPRGFRGTAQVALVGRQTKDQMIAMRLLAPKQPRPGLRLGLYAIDFAAIYGAGDEIRTHDFNLGKVALYP